MEKITCEICGRQFAPNGLHVHVWRVHGPGKNWAPTPSGTKQIWNKGLSSKDRPELTEKLSAGGKSLAKKIKNGEIDRRVWTDPWTPEKRQEQSARKIKLYEDHPEKHPNRRTAGNRLRMTYPEKLAADEMISLGVSFERNKKIGRRYPDFTIGNLCIEIDGDYWHQDPEGDANRDLEIESEGFRIIRIKASENIQSRIREIFASVAQRV